MSLLDDAYRRHMLLRAIASEERAKTFSDPSASRHIQMGIVDPGDEISFAKAKIEAFSEQLDRRIDELGFLDEFVAFETTLNDHRKKVRRRQGRRIPPAKALAQYLRGINHNLADDYELLKFERDKIAHGLLPARPLIAAVIEEKQILELVLAALPPIGSKGAV